MEAREIVLRALGANTVLRPENRDKAAVATLRRRIGQQTAWPSVRLSPGSASEVELLNDVLDAVSWALARGELDPLIGSYAATEADSDAAVTSVANTAFNAFVAADATGALPPADLLHAGAVEALSALCAWVSVNPFVSMTVPVPDIAPGAAPMLRPGQGAPSVEPVDR